jgi:catechol 2,3-dioxygenase-like lactoylglutathione lyase family enzyme
MPSSIDHVVIAVRDLERTVADYQKAGFTVTPGGEHAGGGTHNALVSFADGAYLELIAIKDPVKGSSHPWFSEIEQGDGPVAFALLAANLDLEAARLTVAGLAVTNVRDGGRVRPDGQGLAWRSFNIESVPPAPLPFLIVDVTPRNLRVPAGPATRHALGELRLEGIAILVGDLAAASEPFAALLGAGTELDVPRFSGLRARTRFALGQQWIDLIAPDDSGGDPGETYRRRGAGVYQIDLSAATSDANRTELPLDLTHGLRIRFRG